MKCCVECFRDAEIRAIINSNGQIGDCDYCSNKNVAVYDIVKTSNPIGDAIIDLVQKYSVSDLPEAKPLKSALHGDWDIFNAGVATIQTLVVALCDSMIDPSSEIFIRNVIMPQLHDSIFLNEHGIVRGRTWEQFAEAIKHENRFHSDMFNAKAFEYFLSIIAKPYPIGTELFRARISPSNSGYNKDEMNAPPRGKRSAGRINPEGIGVLYLSSDDKTVLNEVRATTFDYVTIGKFKSLKEIKVVDLSGISGTSPFLYSDELEKYAANRNVFKEIALEVAKPLRRSDSALEYLPTQYIAEFIKSKGYTGVEYASTLREGGYNIAVFDESLFECVGVETVEVTNIQYETRK